MWLVLLVISLVLTVMSLWVRFTDKSVLIFTGRRNNEPIESRDIRNEGLQKIKRIDFDN